MCLKLVSSSVTLDQEGGMVLVLLCCAHLLNTDHPVQINKPERGGTREEEEGGKRRKEGRGERREVGGGRREIQGEKERRRKEEREIVKLGSKTSSLESKSSPEAFVWKS